MDLLLSIDGAYFLISNPAIPYIHVAYVYFWKDLNCVYLGCNELFAKNAGLTSPEEIIDTTDHDLPWAIEEADWYLTCDRRVIDNDQAELDIEETQLTSAKLLLPWHLSRCLTFSQVDCSLYRA